MLNLKQAALVLLFASVVLCAPNHAQAEGFPTNPVARSLVQQGGEHLKNRSFAQARDVLEQALQIEPTNGLIRFRLARAYAGLGNNEGALKEYFASLKLKPHIAVAAYNIGDCYQSLGDLDKALEWFEKYVREEPGDQLVTSAQQRIEALKRISSKFKASNKDGADYYDSIKGEDGPEKWPSDKMPIKVFIDAGSNVENFQKGYANALYEALQTWNQASNGRIRFEVVPNLSEADLVCDWTNDYRELKANATGAESGHTDVKWAMSRKDSTHTRKIYQAHVRILTVDPKGRPVNVDSIKKVCLHELGHAFGVDGHSGNPKDIMFFGESSACLPVLSERDRATILKLYSD